MAAPHVTEAFFIGGDIGRVRDHSTKAVVAQQWVTPDPRHLDPTEFIRTFMVVDLKRYPLMTPYGEVAQDIADTYNHPDMLLAKARYVILDHTGVGAPVVETVRNLQVPVIGINITDGNMVTQMSEGAGFNVPKPALVTTLVGLQQSGRLKILDDIEAAMEFKEELSHFSYHTDRARGTTSYGTDEPSAHDDLVIAVALALWYAERLPREYGEETRSRVVETYNPFRDM